MKLDVSRIYNAVPREELEKLYPETQKAIRTLYEGSGEGNDFLGWLNLPNEITDQELTLMEEAASGLREKSKILVVIGIGGSYLGAKAVNDALAHNFSHLKKDQAAPHMIFAGHNIGEDYLHELMEVLDDYDYSIVSISKSGTTTEPALAFRLLREHLQNKVGIEEASRRMIAITDGSRGALRAFAVHRNLTSFVIPDNVGGRFSFLTPVGLIPLAICGIDIRKLVEGAREMARRCDPSLPVGENPAALYATARNALYRSGKKIEIMVNYNNKLHYVAEWWKQLYGESEGKDGKGIYPSSVDNSSDLHSMGQYIQEGERTLFETVLSVGETEHEVLMRGSENDLDKLDYLKGNKVDHVNKMAELGTMLAHIDGGVPNIRITIPKLDEFHIGALLYFFENACGISGYMLGVNPFNQPGVEAYKKNMFALLGKPGFEAETEAIRKRI